MQDIVLWVGAGMALTSFVTAVWYPLVWPEKARNPMQRTGSQLVFHVIWFAFILYACLYAVGVIE